jgi:hypothetical protein
VAPGVYPEGNINMNQNLRLVSESGPEATTIEGSITVPQSGIHMYGWLVQGFTITGSEGFGISCHMHVPDGVIRDCVVRDNPSIGISLESDATVEGCVVTGNGGDGVVAEGDCLIRDCEITGNYSGVSLLCFGGSVQVVNSLVAGNSELGIVAFLDNTNLTVEHNTVVDNRRGLAVIKMSSAVQIDVSSNVVVNNEVDGLVAEGSGMPFDCDSIIYNNFWGNYHDVCPYRSCAHEVIGYNGNISADPLFCDASTDDFTLAMDSPCLGTGEGGTDMGAYGMGCDPTTGLSTEPMSWSAIKALYR